MVSKKKPKKDNATLIYFLCAAIVIIVLSVLLIGRQLFLNNEADILKPKIRSSDTLTLSSDGLENIPDDAATSIVAKTVDDVPAAEPSVSVSPSPALPALSDSDTLFREKIAASASSTTVLKLLASDNAIQKIVRAVHGVSEGFIVKEFRPISSPSGSLEVSRINVNDAKDVRLFVLDKENRKRYEPYISALNQVQPQHVASVYLHFKVLFEQAYAELGLKDRAFDDVLAKAIERIINIRNAEVAQAEGEALIQPSVMYQYRAKQWESKDGVTKLFFRLGNENTKIIQQWLSEFQTSLDKLELPQ